MGWIITLAILLGLAILPLGAMVCYDADGLVLKVIAGPVRIGILPGKPKEPKEKKPKKQETPKKKTSPAQAQKTKEAGGPITDFLPLVQVVLDLLNSFRRKLRIKRLDAKIIMAGDDPCDLAVNYGRANGALGNLWPLLERCFVIKKRDVQVECDFEATQTLIFVRADITITLGWIIAIAVKFGIRAVKEFINIKNKRKGGASS